MGSAGSGKTTLAEALSQALAIPLVEEGVREWLELRGLQKPNSLSWDLQLELQEYYVASKMRNEATYQAFVSDRTTLDAVVNLQLRHNDSSDWAQIPLTLVECALAYARQTYDRILLLRWSDTPRPCSDGIREVDPRLLEREFELASSLCSSLGLATSIVTALPKKQEIDALVTEFRNLSVEHGGAFSGTWRTHR
jgi:hypothetical protein